MVKVITYGTFDLLHFGHIRLLERAKALGDYLIVGVTADDFDKSRGKINVRQPLMERIEAVKATGLADEIIIEEYEGQKIDDILRHAVDIFTVGSDWEGKFDYLREYCKVIYLDRTVGVSSSDLRAKADSLRLTLVGETPILSKYKKECEFVNGLQVVSICSTDSALLAEYADSGPPLISDFKEALKGADAVYLVTHPDFHYEQIKTALQMGKHVLCESPVALREEHCRELFALAREKGLILMDAVKTAYATAYTRLILLAKSGIIGRIVSVDAVCTSLREPLVGDPAPPYRQRSSMTAWGPTAMLPVFQILGTDYTQKRIETVLLKGEEAFDLFTKINFRYSQATACVKIGRGVKSEGELIVSGTEGYLYVPAPWWKTDYFEIRYENPENNKRNFYPLEGEGIRYELVSFANAIEKRQQSVYLAEEFSVKIAGIMEDFQKKKDVELLHLED